MSIKSPVFILGLPRSGSTLWLNIFAQNPHCYTMGEMHYLTPWRKDFRYFLKNQVGDLARPQNVRKMVDLMFNDSPVPGLSGPFWLYDIKKANDHRFKEILFEKLMSSDKSIGSIFRTIVEEITAFKGYNFFVMKFPVYLNHLPELLEWYPTCKIIHIVRDPRAVAISKTNDPAGIVRKYDNKLMKLILRKIMISYVVIQYVWIAKLHEKYKTVSNYALFRYEDLLADPRSVIKSLCDFVEMEFEPEMLEPREGQASSVTGAKRRGFNNRAASHWKNIITPFEKMAVELLTQNSMKRLGYRVE